MSEDTILKLDHITKRFSGLVAVNDLSLEMKKKNHTRPDWAKRIRKDNHG